jgi:hypothetical protein
VEEMSENIGSEKSSDVLNKGVWNFPRARERKQHQNAEKLA